MKTTKIFRRLLAIVMTGVLLMGSALPVSAEAAAEAQADIEAQADTEAQSEAAKQEVPKKEKTVYTVGDTVKLVYKIKDIVPESVSVVSGKLPEGVKLKYSGKDPEHFLLEGTLTKAADKKLSAKIEAEEESGTSVTQDVTFTVKKKSPVLKGLSVMEGTKGELEDQVVAVKLDNAYFGGETKSLDLTATISDGEETITASAKAEKSEVEFVFSAAELNRLEAGSHVITAASKGNANNDAIAETQIGTLEIGVQAADASITPAQAIYDRYSPADILLSKNDNGNTFSGIMNGSNALTLDTDYTVTGNAVTLKQSYLGRLADGEHTLTFVYDAGTNPTVKVSVGDWTPTRTINVTQPIEGGTVTVTPTTAKVGELVTVDAKASEGYRLVRILLDGTALTDNTFYMPDKDVTVTAEFERNTYKISAAVSPAEGGEISVASSAVAGEEVNIETTAAKGYELARILVDGSEITGSRFTMPDKDVTVLAEFEQIYYQISTRVSPSKGGKVKVSAEEAPMGKKITLKATPASGYEFKSWKVIRGGIKISNNKFTMPAKDVTVQAVFEKSVDPDPVVYNITSGNNSTWRQGSTGTLSFTSEGSYSKFTELLVDGRVVSTGNYSKSSGSTVITLSNRYLSTLSVGEHTLKMNFSDGYSQTKFTIAKKTTTTNNNTSKSTTNTTKKTVAPKTGDTNPIVWLLVLVVVSGAVIVGSLIYKKKSKRNK